MAELRAEESGDESGDDLADVLHGQQAGKREYVQKCAELGIVASSTLIAKLDAEYINLNHHGMGAKGALAVAECLKANDQVRSLNLAENSLGDEGCAAMADVLGANTTLTSLSLASNGIGLLGAQALAGSLRTSGSLVELSLRSNRLDDRAAVQLAASIASSTSLSRLDLSYNRLGEEAGKALGEMLATNRSLLELALAWNGLGNRGCALLADGLRRNSVLSRIDLAYNGLGDDGARAVSDALAHNSSLTHLDLSHNEINADGAHALAGGIEASSLVSVELGFNPMGMTQQRAQQQDVAGVEALVRALRARGSLVSVGLTEVSEGASPKRGRASRYDPEDPAGHYVLDLSQAWDRFLAEKLWARTLEREGEMWANLTLNSVKVGPPGADGGAGGWELPSRGVLEFDHADYRLGLEASLRFELGSAADRRLASSLLGRAAGTEGEACVHARLDGAPCALQAADALPERGVLRMVYVVTRPLKRLGVELELDLGEPAQRALCLELWRRELTTGHEAWARVSLTPPEGGEAAPLDHYAGWRFPAMPEGGVLRLEYTVQLSCKRQDRGACFSAPMEAAKCARLAELLGTEGLSAEERWSLVRMAADANYFTAQQAKALVDAMAERQAKIDAALLLFSRAVNPGAYGAAVLGSLGTDEDRRALLKVVQPDGQLAQAQQATPAQSDAVEPLAEPLAAEQSAAPAAAAEPVAEQSAAPAAEAEPSAAPAAAAETLAEPLAEQWAAPAAEPQPIV